MKPQSRPDPSRYIAQNKSPLIYESVLKSKDDKSIKPSNGGSYSNNIKTPQSIPSKNQEEIEAFELAQAQKSLRLLKSKMSVTPKQINNLRNEDEEEPKTFQQFNNKFNQSSEPNLNNQDNEDNGNQNKNYRKIFKPPMNGDMKKEEMNPNVKRNEEPNYIKMTKNIASSMNGGGGIKNEEFKASLPISQPSKPGDKKMNDKKTTLDDIQKDDYFASKKPAPKYQSQNKPMENVTAASKNPLSSKNTNMKPSPEDYEYYNKNTRHYSHYMYQENASETTQDSRNPKPVQVQKPQNNTINNPMTKYPINTATNSTKSPINNTTNSSKLPNSYDKNKYVQEEEEDNTNNNGQNEDDEHEQEEPEGSDEDQDNNNNDENDDENDQGDGRKIGGGNNLDEYGEPGEIVKCTMGCGRKFNVNAIKKHMKICKKVFQAKRKVFDSGKARTQGLVEKSYGKSKAKAPSQGTKMGGNKKEMWKKQSDAFRMMLKQSKGGQNISPQEEKNLQNTFEEAQGLTMCNFCGRKFNDAAAQKHIPFCENKHRMEKIKQQPGKKR